MHIDGGGVSSKFHLHDNKLMKYTGLRHRGGMGLVENHPLWSLTEWASLSLPPAFNHQTKSILCNNTMIEREKKTFQHLQET